MDLHVDADNTRCYTFEAPLGLTADESITALMGSLRARADVVDAEIRSTDENWEGEEGLSVVDLALVLAGAHAPPAPEELDGVSDVYRCVAAYDA